MADHDFAERVANRKLDEIRAGRAHANAAYESAKIDNDEYSAAQAYDLISEFNQKENQVRRDWKQYVAQNTPQPQVGMTDSERIERFGRTDSMSKGQPTWEDARDALAIINNNPNSKHKITEAEYLEGLNRMRGIQATRGTEQK